MTSLHFGISLCISKLCTEKGCIQKCVQKKKERKKVNKETNNKKKQRSILCRLHKALSIIHCCNNFQNSALNESEI